MYLFLYKHNDIHIIYGIKISVLVYLSISVMRSVAIKFKELKLMVFLNFITI